MHIAQVLHSESWGDLSPDTIQKGLGGRETALIKLAESWARRGHQVTNFVTVEKGVRVPVYNTRLWDEEPRIPGTFGLSAHGTPPMFKKQIGYHEYVPIELGGPMLRNMPWDACVTWEAPGVFNDPVIRENCRVKVCEMQVAHFPPGEIENAEANCDYVAALSDWHADFMIHSGLDRTKVKVITLPNGVDLARYPAEQVESKIRNFEVTPNPLFVYSSSPDRGLWNILKAWSGIRKSFPGAELYVCYGLDKYLDAMKWTHTRHAQMCVEIQEGMKQPGVKNLGKIGQDQLASLQIQADAWLYPLDALWPTETGCITAVENAAAGNPLIISDGDCLETEFGSFSAVKPLPFKPEDLVQAVEKVLTDEDLCTQMRRNGRAFAETRSWTEIGDKWLKLFAQDLS